MARLTSFFEIGSQTIEPVSGLREGMLSLVTSFRQVLKVSQENNYIDQRVAATFVLYPKPFGIPSEFNIGKGPEFEPIQLK